MSFDTINFVVSESPCFGESGNIMTQTKEQHCCECAKIDANTSTCSHRAQYSVDVKVVQNDLKDVHLCADHLAMLWSSLRSRVVRSPIAVKGFARMHAS
jgi:hypothetical protein